MTTRSPRTTPVAHDEPFEPAERPQPPAHLKETTPIIKALLETATNQQAIKISLKGRSPHVVARALTNSVKSHGFRAAYRSSTDDTILVWAEPVTPKTPPPLTDPNA